MKNGLKNMVQNQTNCSNKNIITRMLRYINFKLIPYLYYKMRDIQFIVYFITRIFSPKTEYQKRLEAEKLCADILMLNLSKESMNQKFIISMFPVLENKPEKVPDVTNALNSD